MKLTLLSLHEESFIQELLQRCLHGLGVFLKDFGEDEDVIKVVEHKVIKHVLYHVKPGTQLEH